MCERKRSECESAASLERSEERGAKGEERRERSEGSLIFCRINVVVESVGWLLVDSAAYKQKSFRSKNTQEEIEITLKEDNEGSKRRLVSVW